MSMLAEKSYDICFWIINDKEELHIQVSPEGVDHGKMAIVMGECIQAWIKDQGRRECIVRKFDTTTDRDVAVASVSFTGTMGRYSISD
ncbi:hypothetical protein FQN51_003425 [Onygenales sp. PD_10]|nr:hypothetical protein FQN51_003425 [Onygenales sp. PD_10]